MTRPATWLELAELDSPWPVHWLLGGDVSPDKTAVVAIRGTWEEWRATRLDAEALLQANAITVALCRMPPVDSQAALPGALEACDLRVRISDTVGSTRDWNQTYDTESQARVWVDAMAARVDHHGQPALACARAIRLTARIPALQGLVVESLTYAVLQASARHRQWLAAPSS